MYLVQLVPRLSYYASEEFLQLWESNPTSLSRSKREPITALTISVLLGLGAVGAGTGISSLILSQNRYAELRSTIDEDIQRLQQGIDDLTDSLSSLAEVVLQNHRGLDLLFLQQGGLSAAPKEECCFYVDNTGVVKESMKKIREGLKKRQLQREKEESWYKNWFSSSPWLTTLLPTILGPLVGLLLLISFGPWAFTKLTNLVKQQIENLAAKPIQAYCHRLVLEDRLCSESPDSRSEPPRCNARLQSSDRFA